MALSWKTFDGTLEHDVRRAARRAKAAVREVAVAPFAVGAQRIAELQRAAGNAAVVAALASAGVRPMLRVGAVDEPAEREADRISEQVACRLGSSDGPHVRRAIDSSKAQARTSGHGAEGGAASPDVEQGVAAARAGGQGLDDAVREPLESAFGADLSAVRVHHDSRADQLSRALNATAFTVGRDIFFSHGAYNPHSASGRRVLAHEVTHTLQQAGATAGRTIRRYVDVPDRETWKDDSAGGRTRRSDELKAIDLAIEAYDAARHSSDLALRRRLLYAIDVAIHGWETAKGQKKGEKVAGGGRKAYVSERQGSINDLKKVVAAKLRSTINAYALELAPLAAELNAAYDTYSINTARQKGRELHSKHMQLYARTVSDALTTNDRRKWFTAFFSAPIEAVGSHPINSLTIKAIADFSWMTKAQANTVIIDFIEPVAASSFAVQALQMLQHTPFRQALMTKAAKSSAKRLTDAMPFLRMTGQAERDVATKPVPPSITDIADSVFEAFLGDQPITGLGYATNSVEFKTVDFLLGKKGAGTRAPCMMLSNVLTEVFKALLPGGHPLAAINPIQDTKPLLTKKLSTIGNRGILTRDTTFKGNVEQFGTETGYANVNRIFFGDGHEWLMVGTQEYDPTLGISGPIGTVAAQVEPLTFTAKGSRYDASDGKKVTRNKHTPPGGAALLFERSVVIK